MDAVFKCKSLTSSREFLSPTDGITEKSTPSANMLGGKPDTIVGLFRNQMQNTTAHAVPRIESAKSITRRLFWVLVFFSGLGVFLWQSSIILDQYYDHNTTISIEMKFSKSIRFPAVTFCNLNPVTHRTYGLYLEGDDDDDDERKRRKREVLTPTTEPPEEGTTFRYSDWDSKNLDFEEQNEAYKLTQSMQTYIASLNYTDRRRYGHDLKNMLFDCTWDGYPCSPHNFTQFFNYMYGNCYTFNSGVNGTILSTDKSGPLYGLSLELYIQNGEYIPSIVQSSGVRVVVHDQGVMPFPEDDGFMAAPGFETSVGLRMMEISRKPYPYSNCMDSTQSDVRNIFTNFFGTSYTRKACEKSCYNWVIENFCNCTDTRYKYTNNFPVCNATNTTIATCISAFEALYELDQLDPSCPLVCTQPCDEKIFEATVSNVVWPNPMYQDALWAEILTTSSELRREAQMDDNFIRNNLLKIVVYYNELNYEYIEEQAAYTESDVVSNIGGQVGLWLGVSAMTCCEFIEILCDVCIFLGKKILRSSNKDRSSTPIVPIRSRSPVKKSVKTPELELSGIDFYE